jgi:hypothetical protein
MSLYLGHQGKEEKAIASAWKAYEKAMAAAWKAYKEAIGQQERGCSDAKRRA